jgi:hypothetical protein
MTGENNGAPRGIRTPNLLIRRSIRRDPPWFTVVPVRRVIVRDDLGGRTDRRSGCCQRCCQLADHVDRRRRLRTAVGDRRCCRTARPQLLPYRWRQCTSGLVATSDFPAEDQSTADIHIHLSGVQMRASSAAAAGDGGSRHQTHLSERPERRGRGTPRPQSRGPRRCPRPRRPVRR